MRQDGQPEYAGIVQFGLGCFATEYLMRCIGRGRDRQWHSVHFHCA